MSLTPSYIPVNVNLNQKPWDLRSIHLCVGDSSLSNN
jgi:hypothetical protein